MDSELNLEAEAIGIKDSPVMLRASFPETFALRQAKTLLLLLVDGSSISVPYDEMFIRELEVRKEVEDYPTSSCDPIFDRFR